MYLRNKKDTTMTANPCAKINIGLNIVSRRPDGYHNLETVFYPIPLYDRLSIEATEESATCRLITTGQAVECAPDDNLVVKAYHLLRQHYDLPSVTIQLHKGIPSQAGLGGGSSDVGFAIRLLNEQFHLGMDSDEMRRHASRLGADCAFFIDPQPAYGTGIGDVLTPCEGKIQDLSGLFLAIVKPPVAVSTKEAYSQVHPSEPTENCLKILGDPIESWRGRLRNDFEESVFALYPIIRDVRDLLYRQGALYAQMSGSGSAVFGLFTEAPTQLAQYCEGMFCQVVRL